MATKNTVIMLDENRPYMDTFVVFLESNLAPVTDKPIFVGTILSTKESMILFNSEQMSIENRRNQVIKSVRDCPNLEIWDYSSANVAILKQHGIVAKHIPLESPSWYVDLLRSFSPETKEYDVAFGDSPSTRRNKILDELQTLGVTVNITTGKWGHDKHQEIAKCRVLLNVHYADNFKMFEASRCEPWLKLGMTVISETSMDDDPRCINADYSVLAQVVKAHLDSLKRGENS